MVPFKTFIHVAKLSVSLYFSNKWHQAHQAFLSLPHTDQGWKNGSALLHFSCCSRVPKKLWAGKHWGSASIHMFGWGFLLVFLLILFLFYFLFCFFLDFFFFLVRGLVLVCCVVFFCGFYMTLWHLFDLLYCNLQKVFETMVKRQFKAMTFCMALHDLHNSQVLICIMIYKLCTTLIPYHLAIPN